MAAVFDPVAFVAAYPAFASANPAFLSAQWSTAAVFLGDCTCVFTSDQLAQAQNLMTAHLAYLFQQQNPAGGSTSSTGGAGPGGPITSATEGSVSVSFAPPPSRSSWSYWLGQSPYGQMLLALLSRLSAGGAYIGGLPERLPFRRVGGQFGPGFYGGGC